VLPWEVSRIIVAREKRKLALKYVYYGCDRRRLTEYWVLRFTFAILCSVWQRPGAQKSEP